MTNLLFNRNHVVLRGVSADTVEDIIETIDYALMRTGTGKPTVADVSAHVCLFLDWAYENDPASAATVADAEEFVSEWDNVEPTRCGDCGSLGDDGTSCRHCGRGIHGAV